MSNTDVKVTVKHQYFTSDSFKLIVEKFREYLTNKIKNKSNIEMKSDKEFIDNICNIYQTTLFIDDLNENSNENKFGKYISDFFKSEMNNDDNCSKHLDIEKYSKRISDRILLKIKMYNNDGNLLIDKKSEYGDTRDIIVYNNILNISQGIDDNDSYYIENNLRNIYECNEYTTVSDLKMEYKKYKSGKGYQNFRDYLYNGKSNLILISRNKREKFYNSVMNRYVDTIINSIDQWSNEIIDEKGSIKQNRCNIITNSVKFLCVGGVGMLIGYVGYLLKGNTC